MDTIELKNLLIHQIAAINDKSFLEAIKTILDTKSETKFISLTTEQQHEIIESRKEIERGQFIENDKLEKEIEEWLIEK